MSGHDQGQDAEREAAYVDSERPAEDTGALDPDAPTDTGGLTDPASGGGSTPGDGDDSGVADPENDPQTRPEADAGEAADSQIARENAATSLDQPSDGVE